MFVVTVAPLIGGGNLYAGDVDKKYRIQVDSLFVRKEDVRKNIIQHVLKSTTWNRNLIALGITA